MKFILLPGMDGTGLMFESFISLAPSNVQVEVIPLEQAGEQDYLSQANLIARIIGSEPCIILAESYSGRIAYELCHVPEVNISHVVFTSGFLSNPSFISHFSSLFPLSLIKKRLVPRSLLSCLLFHRRNTHQLIDLFYQALSKVSSKTLKQRFVNIAQLKLPTKPITVPCTYIQASHDMFVRKKAIEEFRKICHDITIRKVTGGHFILQANPKCCWEVINESLKPN